jgi:hypothetical protein
MHFYDRAISVHVFAQRQREILTCYGTFFNAFYLFSQLPKTDVLRTILVEYM